MDQQKLSMADTTRRGAALRALAAERLDPWGLPSPLGGGSDLELNPDLTLGPLDELNAAAVLVPLIERHDGISVLLTRRSDTLRSHRGQIAFPGGRLDPGEAPWQAALREAEEEVGLDRSLVTLAGLSTPYKTGTGYHITPVVGFVDPAFTPRPNPDEVADVFETPFDFLMDAANHERELREFPMGRRWVYSITHNERVIWGVTAAMVRELSRRLFGAAD